ncbi:DUF6177 family protein [Streptomyces boninensis]|uniref:DUF6177 family protein n=1 Tax=Streptomyces boninensis TaxID=2039455 RepID=UPI003B21B6F6
MTTDVVALTPTMPDPMTLLAGLHAGGSDLRVGSGADGAVIQLCGTGGRPLVSIEAPLLLQVPGETERLLGAKSDIPVWWTEARASTAVAEASALAGSFAGRLTAILGGIVHPPEAATTDVIDLPEDAHATTEPEPIVDVLTDSTAVVITDRPIVPLTTSLSAILAVTAEAERALHIVTPHTTRLTQPLHTALSGYPNRWVVQAPDSVFYDGFSGAQLHWLGGTFTPVVEEDGTTKVADAFTGPHATGTEGHQLLLSYRTLHPADGDLELGLALACAWQHLTGRDPAGWSTAEPVNLPWSPRELTELARNRAPEPTLITAIGTPSHPAIATSRIRPTAEGIEENVTLTLGYSLDEAPPLDALEALATDLSTHHHLVNLLATLRTARSDLTTPPHLEAPPLPVALTLGPRAIRDTGLDRALHVPVAVQPTRLNPAADTGVHYPLGDGTDPTAWETLTQLTAHLKNQD